MRHFGLRDLAVGLTAAIFGSRGNVLVVPGGGTHSVRDYDFSAGTYGKFHVVAEFEPDFIGIARDKDIVITAGGGVTEAWDIHTNARLGRTTYFAAPPWNAPIAVSASGHVAVSTPDGCIQVYLLSDAGGFVRIATFTGGWIPLCFSPLEDSLAIAKADEVSLLDIKTKNARHIGPKNWGNLFTLSRDGKKAAGLQDLNKVVVVDLKRNSISDEVVCKNMVCSLAWSPDGQYVVFGDDMGSVWNWRLGTGSPLAEIRVPGENAFWNYRTIVLTLVLAVLGPFCVWKLYSRFLGKRGP